MLFAGYSAAGPTGLNAIGPAYQLLRAFRNDVAALIIAAANPYMLKRIYRGRKKNRFCKFHLRVHIELNRAWCRIWINKVPEYQHSAFLPV